MTNRRLFLAGSVVTTILAFAGASSAQTASMRTLEGAHAAHAVSRVSLHAGRGDVSIVGADVDRIEWRVSLTPDRARQTAGRTVRDWFFRSAYESEAELIAAARTRTAVMDGELRISLEPPVSARGDRIREAWTVVVPRVMAANVQMQVGDIEVEALSGGVRVGLNTGNVTLNVPTGDVDVDLNVGNATIAYGTGSLSAVDLSAGVGRIEYSSTGLRAERRRQFGPGDSVSLRGSGQHEIKGRVNVGDFTLDIVD